MCGIAGFIDYSGRLSEDNLDNILLTQHSRGPENKKIDQLGENIFFGHNRLKIIDLEGLILLNLLESFVPISKNNLLRLIILYIFGNVIVVLIKWYLNSYKGGSISKV